MCASAAAGSWLGCRTRRGARWCRRSRCSSRAACTRSCWPGRSHWRRSRSSWPASGASSRARPRAGSELAVEQARGGGGGIDAARDDLLEQLGHGGVLADRLLELAPQPHGGELHHLVGEVSPAALLERALGLDVLTVLAQLLHELLHAL